MISDELKAEIDQLLMEVADGPPFKRAKALAMVAETYLKSGDWGESIENGRRAAAILREHCTDESEWLYSVMNNIASGHLGLDQYDEAEKIYRDLLASSDSVLKGRKQSIAATHHQLGAIYYKRKDYPRAKEALLVALEIKREVFGASHPQVGMTLHNLAFVLAELGERDAARTTKEEAARMLAPSTVQESMRQPVRASIRLRCLDPGQAVRAIVGPFLIEAQELGVAVDRVATVGEAEIYDELILPPIVTLYIRRSELVDTTLALRDLAVSFGRMIDRFKDANVIGYGDGELFQPTGEAGVFVQWTESVVVRYYFSPDGYESAAFLAIPGTFDAFAPRVQERRRSLDNVVLRREGKWQWFDPPN